MSRGGLWWIFLLLLVLTAAVIVGILGVETVTKACEHYQPGDLQPPACRYLGPSPAPT